MSPDPPREDLAAIWATLAHQCDRFRSAHRDHRAGATVLGSIAADLRATVNRLDTWREQQP